MKIQLDQLDLLNPWPQLRLREDCHRLRLLVRMGQSPIGQVDLRPRGGIVNHQRLRRLIARKLAAPLLRTLGELALAGDGQISPLAIRQPQEPLTSHWSKPIRYVRNNILDPRGLAQPLRQLVESARQPTHTPPVTVVVCTRDRPARLQTCLQWLKQQDYPAYRILVVDNSDDPSPTREIAQLLNVGYLRAAQTGKSNAMNLALGTVTDRWMALTDDDCRPEPQWLRQLVAPTADSQCRCVTGLVLPACLDNEAEILFEEYGGLGRGFRPLIFGPWYFTASRLRPPTTWNIGAGANMLIDRQLVAGFGGYDPDMGAGCRAGTGEDIDIFYQVLRRGYTIHYNPRAIVHHYHRADDQSLRRQIAAYAVGHTAYHWRCLWKFGDLRSLAYLVYHLPRAMAWRREQCLRGKSRYPLSMLAMEARCMLAGPLVYTAAWLRRTFLRMASRFQWSRGRVWPTKAEDARFLSIDPPEPRRVA